MESMQVAADGVTLRLQFEPIPQQSLILFRNGLEQTGNVDFRTNAATIKLLFKAMPGDHFVAWYRY
jgi:hypothetical protein